MLPLRGAPGFCAPLVCAVYALLWPILQLPGPLTVHLTQTVKFLQGTDGGSQELGERPRKSEPFKHWKPYTPGNPVNRAKGDVSFLPCVLIKSPVGK